MKRMIVKVGWRYEKPFQRPGVNVSQPIFRTHIIPVCHMFYKRAEIGEESRERC
jgi:hypothetical protein